MKVIVFLGPTLSVEEAEKTSNGLSEEHAIEFRPPAAQGDVYRAANEKPAMIAIIDGYFERVPSIAHKEILWAMKQGIHVLGASSMGALRAAELFTFGMEGSGRIFDAFVRGELEQDDEVAVAHALQEDAHKPLSVAMVDIRATLSAALSAKLVCHGTHDALIALGKSFFYPDRSYAALIGEAKKRDLPRDEILAFQEALPKIRVDQKKEDALQLLETIRQRLEQGIEAKVVRYAFQRTDTWELICEKART